MTSAHDFTAATDQNPHARPQVSEPASMARLSVAVRGVIRRQGRLLLVSDGDGYWYAPGGRMEPGETLPECLIREVYEETGLNVQVGDLLTVSEYFDPSGEHKIECFFAAVLQDADDVLTPWQDTGGPVASFGLFSDADLAGMDVRPAFLTTARLDPDRTASVYVSAFRTPDRSTHEATTTCQPSTYPTD